jgi:hypothetical protein
MRTLSTLTQEEVHCYDGTFHHVAGTRLLALFGTPVAYEDHARHALLAAWGLHQRLAASQRGDPAAEPLAACLGLHTGLMVGMRPLVAHCHRGPGTLYAQLGQREQAQTALSTAIALYRAMAVWYDPRRIQEVLRAHATVACDPGSPCLVRPTTV